MRHLILLLALLSASCSSTLPSFKTYKLDVQQGNVISAKMMLQLKPGMSKSQVRYVLGTPLLQDSFHPERWDYLYEMNRGGRVIERRRVVLEFGDQGLKMVRGDIIPAGEPGAENAPIASVEDVVTATSNKTLLNEDPQKSWWDRLKFWGEEEPVVKSSAMAPKVYEGAMKISLDASAKPEPDLDQVASDGAIPLGKDSQSIVVVNQLDQPPVKGLDLEDLADESKDLAGSNMQDQLLKRLDAWASAWRTKNITEYLSFYSSKFIPDGLTKKDWLAQRKQRLAAKQGAISLTLENAQVSFKGALANVQFDQHFSAGAYSDHVIKSLVFEFDRQQWMIVSEKVISKINPSQAKPTQEASPVSGIKEKTREEILNEKTEGPPIKPVQTETSAEDVKRDNEATLPLDESKEKSIEEFSPVEIKPSSKPAKKSIGKPASKASPSKDAPLIDEEEPGYFDRILEKIGF
jgi:outer membrane protein assembly factor BamE (lipoprotein component of BamABCDE complex)